MENSYDPSKKKERINYKYYCIDERPELIDLAGFKQYIQLLSRILNNFKRIVQQYVVLYDAGKIIPNATIIKEKEHIAVTAEVKALSTGTSEPFKKLKMDLSVPQLAYIFKLLYDFKLIPAISKAELKRFIIAHFSTLQAEAISDKSLANKLSETEKAEAEFWADKFMDMYKAAKKV